MTPSRQFAEQVHVDARVFERLAVLGTMPSDLWLEHVTDRLVAQIVQQHELEAEWAAMKRREWAILHQSQRRDRLYVRIFIASAGAFVLSALALAYDILA